MPGLGRDLVVNLAGNNAKLKSTIAESKGGLKGFASAATSMLNPITAGFAAVAAGALSAGVAVYGLTSNIDKLDKVAKDAARTGVSGAFLQQLTFAADQSGVGIEQLTAGVKKLTIAIGKGDATGFESIGISLNELKNLNPEQQFLRVAEAIGKLPTAAERAAASVKLFGKSGIELTTLFGGGMDGINKLMERAQELNIGVSAEGLAQVEAANDALGQMKASFGALIDQVTVGLSPAFTFVSTTIADWIPPLTEFIGKFNGLSDKAGFLGEAFQAGMDVGIETIKEHWNEMLDDMVKASLASALQIADNMNPKTILKNLSIVTGIGQSKPAGNPQATPLQNAKDRFSGVMSQLNSSPSTVAPTESPGGGPVQKPPVNVAAIESLFGGIAESAKGIFSEVETAVTTKVTEAGITGNWFMKTAENMFTGDKKQQKTDAPKLSAAANKGSQEALRIAMRGTANTYETKALKWQEKAFEIAKQTLQATKDAGQQLVAEF